MTNSFHQGLLVGVILGPLVLLVFAVLWNAWLKRDQSPEARRKRLTGRE